MGRDGVAPSVVVKSVFVAPPIDLDHQAMSVGFCVTIHHPSVASHFPTLTAARLSLPM
jgi:hypothetical protein